MGLLNPGGPIAQFKRNRCSISPVELILQSGVRIYRTQYNGACCEQLEESYLKGAVYALAETINRCGPLLDEDYLQLAADRLELPLENLKKRLDAVMKEFFSE